MILTNIYYQTICIFVLGLIFGSFYNVLIVRSITKESIIFPPSKCPKCQKQLKWYHNIPILSYIILKGKCHFCKQKIDTMYPIVELCTGILFLISYIKLGVSLKTIFCITTLSLFLILTGMDIKTKTISLKYSYLLIISALLFNIANISDALLGVMLSIILCLILKVLSYILKKEIIGEGDIYVFAGLGAFVGIKLIPYFFIISLILQCLIYFPKYILYTIRLKEYHKLFAIFWCFISYVLVFLIKNNYIIFSKWLQLLIFINFILSLILVCKYLTKSILNSQKHYTEPFLPAIFLSAVIYLLLI